MARLGFTVGNIFRETGIALERLGSRLGGDYSFTDTLSRHQASRSIFEKKAKLGKGSFVAPTASVTGSVTVGSNSNIWYGATVRGDDGSVTIGENTNIKENAILSATKADSKTVIGSNVTVGAGAKIGAATIEDNASVGAGANIHDGAIVQKGAAIAAGSVVAAGTTVPAGQLFAGVPAKFLRDLSAADKDAFAKAAAPLGKLAAEHLSEISKPFKQAEKDVASFTWRSPADRGIDGELGLLQPLRPQVFDKEEAAGGARAWKGGEAARG
eukprot:CAMPEP_0113683080 /NCGR_PEP_ID=MMETSP0038_2-20120614/13071_1 /TAXON_ID=2898 /ORGANISM="Cryptomonas paramecium" /LENGTH=269 /DNA_ID=CAMNT_0000602323 /DNA_START=20 /DNA_END=826 /DNA_ORIENTATION=- /assembly_acc=CAM_ASM_000170